MARVHNDAGNKTSEAPCGINPVTDMLADHEQHHVNRLGWLRAAVLGANDGILSTASLIVGEA
jgi:VIT1/CCC1 family predicted Fe2+/Mn2+ transporter